MRIQTFGDLGKIIKWAGIGALFGGEVVLLVIIFFALNHLTSEVAWALIILASVSMLAGAMLCGVYACLLALVQTKFLTWDMKEPKVT
jgi:hypothetical protein